MSKKLSKWFVWIIVLCAMLMVVSIFALCIGSAGIPLTQILPALIKGKGTTEYAILMEIRLPRIVLGFALGGALSVAGVILQGMFRNPLVEPYTLGISGGAALGVCLNIVFGMPMLFGIISYPLSGFLGAGLAIVLVYYLSIRKGILKIQGVLLTGVMISFISSSLIMLIMALSKADDLHGIVFWIMGSLEEPSWMLIRVSLFVSALGLIAAYYFCFALNAFSLGEEDAFHLGINTERTKKYLFIIASVLTGVSVSVAGIIGFIGLVVPHFTRMFIGRDHRILIISSYLAGGIFLIFCDTLSRAIISPLELPVGVITGIAGGTLFVYALSKRQINLGKY